MAERERLNLTNPNGKKGLNVPKNTGLLKESNFDSDYAQDKDQAKRMAGEVMSDADVERVISEQEKLIESLIAQIKKTFLGKILYEQDKDGNYIPGDYEINPETLERKFIPNPESKNHKEVDTITDVSFDGNYIYIQDNLVDRYRLNDPKKDPRILNGLPPLNVTEEMVKQLGKDVANRMGMGWNQASPIMDVEIGHLRSNFMDSSVAPYGVTMAIRVSRASLALRDVSQAADQEVADLLEVFMRCGLNLLVSGPTGTVNKNRYKKIAVHI